MVRVTTQSQAQTIRSAIKVCYLCGHQLALGSGKTNTSAEHVIPHSILPASSTPVWPIILDVHIECEKDLKRERDAWMRLFHQFHMPAARKLGDLWRYWKEFSSSSVYKSAMEKGNSAVRSSFERWVFSLGASSMLSISDNWIDHIRSINVSSKDTAMQRLQKQCIRLIGEVYSPEASLERGHYKPTPFRVEWVRPGDVDDPIPALSGGEELVRGVWTWIRGCHMFLYGEYLPEDSPHRVLGDTPLVGRTVTESESDAVSEKVRAALLVAERAASWDGIAAWGGTVVYKCVWVSHEAQPKPIRCVWSLAIKTNQQEHIWWCGFYDQNTLPESASCIT